MVERPHGGLRSSRDIDCDRFYNSGDNLDHSGMRCRQLDYIDGKDNRFMSSEALSSNWKRGIQISSGSTGDRVVTETVTANVKSTGRKGPNVIAVEPRKTADRPVYCPVSVVPTPQGEAFKSRSVGTHAGELFPKEPEFCSSRNGQRGQHGGPYE